MNDRIIHKRSNSPNKKPIIEIKNLAAGYDGRTVLHDVDLNVYERDFLGIIGPNGGGKTTLIKCILGLLKPTAGEIIFHTPTSPPSQPPLSHPTSSFHPFFFLSPSSFPSLPLFLSFPFLPLPLPPPCVIRITYPVCFVSFTHKAIHISPA